MSVFNSFGKPMIALVLILLVFGVAFGMLTTNFDPAGNAARARQIDVNNEYQAKINQLDLQVKAAKNQAEIERLQREKEIAQAQYELELKGLAAKQEADTAQYQKILAQDLIIRQRKAELQEAITITLTISGATSVLMVVLSLAALLIRYSKARWPTSSPRPPASKQAEPQPDNPWNLPGYKQQQIEMARRRELEARAQAQRMLSNYQRVWPKPERGQGFRDLPRAG